MNARDRLTDILDEYPTDSQEEAPTVESLDDSNDRIILIEKNNRSGYYWLTIWLTPHDAVDYHFSSEYPGDYDIVDIIDLDTGERYEPTHTARKVKP